MTAHTISGSSVARRLLGWSLRDLRQQARLKVKTAAAALEWSEPKLWRIETGQTAVRGLDVEAMCAVYGAPPGLAQALAAWPARPGQTAGGTPTVRPSPAHLTYTPGWKNRHA